MVSLMLCFTAVMPCGMVTHQHSNFSYHFNSSRCYATNNPLNRFMDLVGIYWATVTVLHVSATTGMYVRDICLISVEVSLYRCTTSLESEAGCSTFGHIAVLNLLVIHVKLGEWYIPMHGLINIHQNVIPCMLPIIWMWDECGWDACVSKWVNMSAGCFWIRVVHICGLC